VFYLVAETFSVSVHFDPPTVSVFDRMAVSFVPSDVIVYMATLSAITAASSLSLHSTGPFDKLAVSPETLNS
jgi:hypothetical protein